MQQGSWVQGVRSGQGTFTSPNGQDVYEGNFSNDEFHGAGVHQLGSVGEIFEGNFVRGHLEGVGRWSRSGEEWFEGSFSKGLRSGRGALYTKSGLTAGRTAEECLH
jgi:hypothetical protein